MLHNGLGRFGEALPAALRGSEPTDGPGPADALGRLEEMTRVSGTDWALGVEAGARVLLSGGQAAEDLYLEAIERLPPRALQCAAEQPRAGGRVAPGMKTSDPRARTTRRRETVRPQPNGLRSPR